MSRFIEVHVEERPCLVNTRWIQGIADHTIFFALFKADITKQDYMSVDETYEQIKALIDNIVSEE